MARSTFHLKTRRRDSRLLFLAAGATSIVLLGSSITLLVLLQTKEDRGPAKVVVVKEAIVEAEVLVPILPIKKGTKLEATLFQVEKKPAGLIPNGALTSFDQVRGYYARHSLPAHQPIHPQFVSSVRPGTIADDIPDGYRAVAIRVDERSAIEGWAQAGTIVDVIHTGQLNGQMVARTIVQRAKILSAGGEVLNGEVQSDPSVPKVPNTLSLLVTASDSMTIRLAEQTGTLSLSLCPINGIEPGPPGSITTSQIWGSEARVTAEGRKSTGSLRVKNKDGSYSDYTVGFHGDLEPQAK
jgi:Flp pilus assembly protein CpaB